MTLCFLSASWLAGQGNFAGGIPQPVILGQGYSGWQIPVLDTQLARGYTAAPWLLRLRLTTQACFKPIPMPLDMIGDPPCLGSPGNLRTFGVRHVRYPDWP
jgi:hypothetical protein